MARIAREPFVACTFTVLIANAVSTALDAINITLLTLDRERTPDQRDVAHAKIHAPVC